MRGARRAAAVALAAAVLACQGNESAIARGDRLWADSAYTEAMAEYRLAAAQRGDEEALARLAHALTRQGELADARDTYDELLLTDSSYADQAAYDYLYLMDRSQARGDAYGVATALDAALKLRPELEVPGAARAVARFHRDRGDADQARAYYRRALGTLPPDSATDVLYELGVLNEEQGRCAVAIDYYRAFETEATRVGPRPWRTLLGEARWHTGNCAFLLAGDASQAGRVNEALRYYAWMIDLGEPENLLDRAWFEQGELLYTAGRLDDALASFRMVLERNPARAGQLVERARERIDEIRFGSGVGPGG